MITLPPKVQVNKPKPDPKRKPGYRSIPASRLEIYRAIVEGVAFLALILTVVLTYMSVNAANDEARATRDAVETSTAQLQEAQYESVYGHQLDLWNLAAGSADLAPYIVGGKRPDPKAVKQAHGAKAKAKAEALRARQDAALFTALDFDAYVFSQLAPRFDDGTVPPGALMVRQEQRPQWGMTQADWDAWATWAATIKSGFSGAPGMCDVLSPDAYETELIDALHEARLCV
jgi:hypothetical protein